MKFISFDLKQPINPGHEQTLLTADAIDII